MVCILLSYDQKNFFFYFFFFNDTATTEIYTLSLHDALPIDEGQDGLSDSDIHPSHHNIAGQVPRLYSGVVTPAPCRDTERSRLRYQIRQYMGASDLNDPSDWVNGARSCSRLSTRLAHSLALGSPILGGGWYCGWLDRPDRIAVILRENNEPVLSPGSEVTPVTWSR